MVTKKSFIVVLVVSAFVASSNNSWAEIPGGTAPSLDEPVTIDVVHYEPKKSDLFAQYTIPGSSFQYSEAKSAVGAAVSTFVLGKPLSDMARDAKHNTAVGAYGPQLPDLDKILSRQVEEKLAKAHNPKCITGKVSEGHPKLELSPRALLFSDPEGQVAFTIYLETKILDQSGSRIWWNRYHYKTDEKKVLTGPDGWLGESGALSAVAERSIDIVLGELLIDLIEPPSLTKEIRFRDCLGGEKNSRILLRETADYYVTKADLGRNFGPTTFLFSKIACHLAEAQ